MAASFIVCVVVVPAIVTAAIWAAASLIVARERRIYRIACEVAAEAVRTAERRWRFLHDLDENQRKMAELSARAHEQIAKANEQIASMRKSLEGGRK